MKKNIFLAFLLPALFAFTIVSCKTTPKAETTDSQTSKVAASLYSAKADAARKRAMDFDSQNYFPSDWETVERQYAAAGRLPTSNDAEKKVKTDAFDNLVNTYDELYKKSVPLYAQAREDEIMEVRKAVIELDVYEFSGYIRGADDMALNAKAQYEAVDYYKAKASADEALAEYNLLNLGSRVYLIRMEISDRGFESYDSDNLEKADVLADQALSDYKANKKETAKMTAEEAELRYKLILKNCWIRYASDRQKSATDEKKQAATNKVNIAMRDVFREADVILTQAEEDYKAEKYESAVIQFTEAETRFAVAGRETEEKRQLAEDTIKMAEEKITASEETAIRIEKYLDGGSR